MDNFLFLPRSFAASLFDLAFAVLSGLAVVSLWLPADEEETLGFPRKELCCMVALLLALTGQAALLAATMTGSYELSVIRPQFAEVMTGTHSGRVLLLSGAVALVLFVVLLVRRELRRWVESVLLLALLGVLTATRAATGHPAADGDFTLPEFVQFLHLTSIAIWSGGVIATGFFVAPAMLRAGRFDTLTQSARRLSQVVTWALLLIVLTGTYNSYRELGASLAPLAHTQWGGFLDWKLILVGTAVALGAYNRRLLRTGASLSEAEASRLAFFLRAEAIVMLLILTVSAGLANSPPANSPD